MGNIREGVPAAKLEPISGKRIGLPRASMKNRAYGIFTGLSRYYWKRRIGVTGVLRHQR
jgi:hypothetical protein